ncbi:hypothetical protein OIU77_004532, partial [Salix suchowensis]
MWVLRGLKLKKGSLGHLRVKLATMKGKVNWVLKDLRRLKVRTRNWLSYGLILVVMICFFGDVGKDQIGSEILGESEGENESKEVNLSFVAVGETKPGDEVEKRKLVWWKVPFEMLRYCVFRFSPVWSVSVAAAVMGFLILGRRLYKMKRKTKSLQLKVTVDDK